MIDFSRARQNMVESQLRTNQVTDERVLAGFETVPRELFVVEGRAGVAYCDEDIPCGAGRCLMEPMILARLLQALEIGSNAVVLDVGCGTGYSSAVIARLAATVVGLECEPTLVARANALMTDLAIDNVMIAEGALDAGHPAQAPYDAILVNGAAEEVPRALTDQLAEGGRLGVVCVGDGCRTGSATLFVRSGGVVSGRKLFDAAVPVLPGFESRKGFVF
jgi:protein-L-isoaspartate(D-aspartate) O-methyltransferase